MKYNLSSRLQQFQDYVAVPFQLYNSLFTSLPFNRIEKTGILLSLFLNNCEEGYANSHSPRRIVEDFFDNHASVETEAEKLDLLFRFVQYAERQVVLFDALEDAAFRQVNDFQGAGTLKHLESSVLQNNKKSELLEKLKDFSVRLVLTAHPTQFYPGAVLGIINDLVAAIGETSVADINTYLQQLGRTPFIKKQKPTPFDEAVSLIWYLENVFYDAIGNIVADLNDFAGENFAPVKMGFWSGGDRDGNPFVTVKTALQVADALRNSILRCYYRDVRSLKRRLTFAGVEEILAELEAKLRNSIYNSVQNTNLTETEILAVLNEIRRMLFERHNGLFVSLVENLLCKVESFGLYFAALDIRQDSSAHRQVLEFIARQTDSLPDDFAALSDDEKISALLDVKQTVDAENLEDELAKDTLETVAAVKTIQRKNGAASCQRYIISHCQNALNVIEVVGLFTLGGWKIDELSVDIVPLFETIADLENAAEIMKWLYENPIYREHLRRRGDTQTIMLGFSDGTKDGGYLTANWSIYKAKKELTAVSSSKKIDVIFFDGRGGPPARGGGKTHKFYSSMGAEVSGKAIELTVQGQTVSSNFGTIDAAQYNIEQLLHAGLDKDSTDKSEKTFTADEEELIQKLANESFRAYQDLKNHPLFLDYLTEISPLRFYAETNIGSRPAKRNASEKLKLEDLRAIPFVGAWSQLKQNVPGFYGVGTALRKIDAEGKFDAVQALYSLNAFFKALLDNCEMAMQKSFFPLTEFLSDDPIYAEIWNKINNEYELTRRYLLMISEKNSLMSDYPIELQSIEMRERIMLPLTTIQQFALTKLREPHVANEKTKHSLEKIIVRCSFGIINAGRNSV
ncbi:MAG: phosphoenolpyruvate carboxylase [Acidobacteriota bacterium]|nr:phosphoenolpyruvate carboxylase [Acidobacteriota bacterium]